MARDPYRHKHIKTSSPSGIYYVDSNDNDIYDALDCNFVPTYLLVVYITHSNNNIFIFFLLRLSVKSKFLIKDT